VSLHSKYECYPFDISQYHPGDQQHSPQPQHIIKTQGPSLSKRRTASTTTVPYHHVQYARRPRWLPAKQPAMGIQRRAYVGAIPSSADDLRAERRVDTGTHSLALSDPATSCDAADVAGTQHIPAASKSSQRGNAASSANPR